MSNEAAYASADLVKLFVSSTAMQPPERAILRELRWRLASSRMLDIGVGGGRTTEYFAPLAKSYVGIDLAPPMVDACKRRFPEMAGAFEVGDARRLRFSDRSFDFVLFSFNGLDYVNHEERLQALAEIRRVLDPGGVFCFSSHNLRNVDEWYTPLPRDNPWSALTRAPAYALLAMLNPSRASLEDCEHAVLNDGAYRFRLRTYYIRPEAQIAQLRAAGFENVRVWSRRTGREITDERALRETTDPWLYYLSTPMH